MGTVSDRTRRIRATREYRKLRTAMDYADPVRHEQRENWKGLQRFLVMVVILVGAVSCALAPAIAEAIKNIPW